MDLQLKIKELLNKRGLTSEEEIHEFLSDKPQKTYDPFLLLNMKAGVDLILSSIEDGKRICVYGDYDADGITSTALMTEVLSKLTDNLTFYIPSRFDEGYGLNCDALNKIKEEGIDLIITVDCGSVSCAEVEHAKKIGLKILITDHHRVTDRLADCIVINPMQPGCSYPFKYLAGVGVAFKVAQALAAEAGLEKEIVNRTLDLVGIGTIGDIVPLVDENRTLAKYGIRAINVSQRKGLVKLIEGVGLSRGNINSENISYMLVPHLNAAGRMKSAEAGVRLMLTEDAAEAVEGVRHLLDCNIQRKKIQEKTFQICRDLVEQKYSEDLFYLINLEDAHEGITGIVAGKIKDEYNRPTVILTSTGEGCLKGTGRSVENVNIYDLLKVNDDLFERFGGHESACGFTMKRDHLQILRENLNNEMEEILRENPKIFDKCVEAEMSLAAEDISLQLASHIESFAPFGCANPRPVIKVTATPSSVSKMGSEGQYTRFTANLDDGKEIKCVIFTGAASYDRLLQKSEKISIIGTLEQQIWNGREYLQINVLNIGE